MLSSVLRKVLLCFKLAF